MATVKATTLAAGGTERDPDEATASDGGVRILERAEWLDLASRFADHNYRQCWEWSKAMADRGNAAVENVAILDGEDVAGLASVRIKRLPLLGGGVAYVPGGPLVKGDDGAGLESRLGFAIDALRRRYVEQMGLVLRFAPLIGDADWVGSVERCYEAAGFAPTGHLRPYNTILLDLADPLADLRAGFAKRWRRNLGKSERGEFELLEGTGPELFEDFKPLFDDLVARKAFAVGLGAEYYSSLQPEMEESERLLLFIARVDGAPAAGLVTSMLGDTAVYLLAASNDVGRETNAAYILQWKAIEAAIARGCRWYDLGGINPEGNPGVYQFKSGMGGFECTAPGPYELGPGGARAGAVRMAERLVRATESLRRSAG